MIIETFREHFSISIFGRKSVCRLTYSISNLYYRELSRLAHSRTSSLAELTSFLARNTICNLCHVTKVLHRLHNPCLGLSSPNVPINAWYFYTDISAGSNGNFGGKTGRTSDCRVRSVLKNRARESRQTKFVQFVSDHRTKCWNTLDRFQWSF